MNISKISLKMTQYFTGKQKFLRCTSGKTLKSDEDFLRWLNEQKLNLKEVFCEKECDFILVFCPVFSRAGTDIEAALSRFSGTKPAVLVVLHHTFDTEYIAPDSSRTVNRKNTMTVDCLFHEDRGLLRCLRNQKALDKVTAWLKPQMEKHIFAHKTHSELPDNKEKRSCKEINIPKAFPQKVKNTLAPILAEQNKTQLTKSQVEALKELLNDAESLLGNGGKEMNNTEMKLQDRSTNQPEKISTQKSPLRLMLLGKAEAEKSKARTCLSEANQGDNKAEKHLLVLNTPDCFKPELSDDIINGVRDALCQSAPGPHAFLLVIPVKKDTGEEKGMLERMEELFGEHCWQNTIVLLTVTEEKQKNSIEEFRSRNDEVHRLVEKCGNRFHCLNVNKNRDGSQVSELLNKLEEHPERFYSHDIYHEIREMEKRILDKILREINETIQSQEKVITELTEKVTKLQNNLAQFENTVQVDTKKMELEINKELLSTMNRCQQNRKREQEEMNMRQMQDIKRLRCTYDGEDWREKDKELMKIILPEVHIMLWNSKMHLKKQPQHINQTDLQNLNTTELNVNKAQTSTHQTLA